MQCIELRTTGSADRIVLRGVRLVAHLAGMSLKAKLEQAFVNREKQAIEAVYTFPLPDGAAVCGFEVRTNDRVWVGQIEEKEKAIEAYDQAIEAGEGAFMAEQDRPDVFSVRVGNLKPDQSALVRIEYVCALEMADRAIRVAFPTTVAPRYVSAAGMDPIDAAIDGDAQNPPHLLHVPYGLSAEIEIDLGRDLCGVTSPSHAIEVRRGESSRSCHVTLAGQIAEMNRDLVLSIELAKEAAPAVQIAGGDEGESYVSISFLPEFTVDPSSRASTETVFVLDCSGSMQGESIAQATQALGLCLRSLSPGDTFNICRFGSTCELLGSESLPYTQKTLDQALRWINRDADLGGTELLEPLSAIFKTATPPGVVRQIVLLTDGQVSNAPALLKLARSHRRNNRIFSFGIGAACSSHLVRGLARATGGCAEFIIGGERIDDKVLRTFSRIASPMLSDVSLDWHNADVQTLSGLPPVFDGDVFSVIGRVAGRLPEQVTLHCRSSDGPQSWTVSVPRHAPREADHLLQTMWARRAIQSIEEVNDVRNHHAMAASIPTKERQMLIDLSRRYGILSVLTNFVAIEHRSLEERNEGRPALRRIPVMLANGWGGVEIAPRALVFACAGAPTRKALRRRGVAMDKDVNAGSGLLDLTRESDDELREEIAPSAAARLFEAPDSSPPTKKAQTHSLAQKMGKLFRKSTPPAADPLYELLSKQLADGSFDLGGSRKALALDAELYSNAVKDQLEALIPASLSTTVRESALQTGVVILLLKKQHATREALWRRAYDKSLRYLARLIGRSVDEVRAALHAIAPKAR